MLEPFMVEAALLHYAGEQWHDPSWYIWDERDRVGSTYEIPGLGIVTVVAQNMPKNISYAEHSEDIWIVFDVQGTLYRKLGTYTSYVGTEYKSGMDIVVPKPRTVIDYVEKEND